MKLKTLNKTIVAAKIGITYKQGYRFESWHVDYISNTPSRHYDNLHYVTCMGEIPAEVMNLEVLYVSVNHATGELDISLEEMEV